MPQHAKKITIFASVRSFALRDVKAKFYMEGLEDHPPLVSFNELEPMQLSTLQSGEYKLHFELYDDEGEKLLQKRVYTLEKEMQFFEHTWYRLYLILVCVEIIAFATWTVLIQIQNNKRKKELESLRKELEDKLEEKTSQIKQQEEQTADLFVQTITALSEAVDAKDHYTSGHSKRVATYAKMLAARMGKSPEEQDAVYRAGLLHDIGKIRVPEDVLNKPGKLTSEEFELIKMHPVTGYHILRGIAANRQIALGAKFHHERYDGKGYPGGVAGENIPEIARIIGVADAYDAMASTRSYRRAMTQAAVRAEIEKGIGTQFDPSIAGLMLEMIDEDVDYTMRQVEKSEHFILVVDDDDMNFKMTQMVMQNEPVYKLVHAKSGEEALKQLAKQPFELILLDVLMPGMDGFEAFEKIKESYDIPIIFLTGDKNIETIQRISELDAEDYLTKPLLSIALREAIHSAFD